MEEVCRGVRVEDDGRSCSDDRNVFDVFVFWQMLAGQWCLFSLPPTLDSLQITPTCCCCRASALSPKHFTPLVLFSLQERSCVSAIPPAMPRLLPVKFASMAARHTSASAIISRNSTSASVNGTDAGPEGESVGIEMVVPVPWVTMQVDASVIYSPAGRTWSY